MSTTVERCHGCRPISQPIVGPLYITATTTRLSSRLARPSDSPSPRTRNGNPHSNVIAVALNWVTKCIQKPSRVPGCDHDAARLERTAPSVMRGPRRLRTSGASWTRVATATDATTLTPAAVRYACVQPR